MATETAVAAGWLFAVGTYLLLGRGFVSIVFGLALLSNGANLLVLAASGSPAGRGEPIVIPGAPPPVDPLPQALVLTAIVIGFGTLTYSLVLLYRLFLDHRTTDVSELYEPDRGRR